MKSLADDKSKSPALLLDTTHGLVRHLIIINGGADLAGGLPHTTWGSCHQTNQSKECIPQVRGAP